MSKQFSLFFLVIIFLSFSINGQDRSILVPKPIAGSPFQYNDTEDLFGKSYRWFLEGEVNLAMDSLKKMVKLAGINLNPESYYVVIANFQDEYSPIGLFHENDDFFSTRMYGLKENNLFYIFISRKQDAPSYLSVLATSKSSPFAENLPAFLGFFPSVSGIVSAEALTGQETWIDVRQFTMPEAYQKFSDLSFIIKKDLSDEKDLANVVFDNTSKERWSYGVATAITDVNEVDFLVGNDGTIIVRPKPNLDFATFAVINYHFKAVDTKAKTLASSFHLLAGLRLSDILEPIIGVGGGISLDIIDLHLFAGMSVEVADDLKSEYSIGQKISKKEDPFKTKLRAKARFGIELKFP